MLKCAYLWNNVYPLFYPPGGLFISKHFLMGGGGGWGLFERDGLFDLAKMEVSFLYKGLECKVEKFKNKKLEVMQLRPIKNKSAHLTHE